MRNFRTLHEFLMEGLANNDEAIDFLKVALEEYQEDDDTPFFLKSIRTVIEAQIGISELAKRTHMSPDALQRFSQVIRHRILTHSVLFSMRLDADFLLNL